MKKQKTTKVAEEVPKDKQLLFGKFYFYSAFVLLFIILYPFCIMEYLSFVGNIITLIVIPILYVFMVIDVLKKRETYKSTIFLVCVVLILSTYLFSLIKFIFGWNLVLF